MKSSPELEKSDALALKSINDFLELISGYMGWANDFKGETLKLISASSSPVGKTVFEFMVKQNHVNGLGNLHGGCCATLFDYCTTTAIIPVSSPDFWMFKGVSRTLNVTYLRPVPTGEVVLIESEVVHIGKRLCTLKGVMKRKSDGAVLAICEHGKVNVDLDVNSKV